MKTIMQIALVSLLAISTAAYGNNKPRHHKKSTTCPSTCQTVCNKQSCEKVCSGASSCPKANGMNK